MTEPTTQYVNVYLHECDGTYGSDDAYEGFAATAPIICEADALEQAREWSSGYHPISAAPDSDGKNWSVTAHLCTEDPAPLLVVDNTGRCVWTSDRFYAHAGEVLEYLEREHKRGLVDSPEGCVITLAAHGGAWLVSLAQMTEADRYEWENAEARHGNATNLEITAHKLKLATLDAWQAQRPGEAIALRDCLRTLHIAAVRLLGVKADTVGTIAAEEMEAMAIIDGKADPE